MESAVLNRIRFAECVTFFLKGKKMFSEEKGRIT